ncbi:clathrin adaptor, mu subunit [Suhomyces tanzawaensis NRRL Y-17324]|uniref:Clathrin adaptor, mu subunit n=1 Tax=Suhomyces tanzawaensis NRRL Y-17324 TaxID=984487 RepID=A0A1E4SR63_9ASCO|nr:clathrin adaptor, mu subunit [Suhomyces tanzawaensis NRRL Y-17324]ODV81999.1 clathrin adaptor, mu subunit [Suhomyces tanzawaensis NRRL Y-17324]
MITALFVYDGKGDVIMSKMYKEGVRRNISDVFRIQVISANQKTTSNGSGTGKEVRSPVLTLGSTSFVYIRSGLLWICAVTRSNQDCSMILEFLYKLEALLSALVREGNDSFSKVPLTDELLINNFALIHEILDEVVEFGYPTNLDISGLRSHITSIPNNGNVFKDIKNTKVTASTKKENTSISTLNITWRNGGIKYRRNEIFLKVEEKINVIMNYESEVSRALVEGEIKMKAHLSGMPECHFGLSDDSVFSTDIHSDHRNTGVTLEDCKFHQCVELKRFDSERSIHFIPPDGDFQMMSYRCLQNIHLPFKVNAQVQERGSRVQYKLGIKSLFPSKLPATNVIVKIPTPKGVIKSYSDTTSGKCKYQPDENVFVWKFSKFFGEQSHTLTAELDYTPNTEGGTRNPGWLRPPITIDFELEMFSSSGLAVKYLRVQEKSNYRTVKWVKYSTKAGSYEVRY